MAWKGLHLTSPARLTLADGQVVVDREGGEVRLALEDIAYVIIDTPHATLTSTLVAACMAAGIVLVFSDARHTPAGLCLPFHSHHRQAAVAALQQGCSGPLKKRLWQTIVVAKIENQAASLSAVGAGGDAGLRAMARLVGSGDPDNVEARAAREYWGRLFPDFRRDDGGDYRNMCLNYGYAVVRALVARCLVAYGLLPSLGLHHASAGNAFNLADDMVEPFRPFVDGMVWRLADAGRRRDGEPSREDRQTLAGLALQSCRLGRETVSLLVAADLAADSLVRALETSSAAVLRLPRLTGDPP